MVLATLSTAFTKVKEKFTNWGIDADLISIYGKQN